MRLYKQERTFMEHKHTASSGKYRLIAWPGALSLPILSSPWWPTVGRPWVNNRFTNPRKVQADSTPRGFVPEEGWPQFLQGYLLKVE